MQFSDALARHQRGDLTGAEAGYRAILAADPSHYEAWEHLGVIFGQRGQFVDAEGVLRRALAVRPGSAGALYNLGLALQQLGRHDEAASCYTQILESGPASPDVLLNLGNAYRALERYDEAVAAYEKVAALMPNEALPQINLADLLRQRGQVTASIRHLRRAIELRPDIPMPRRAIAGLFTVSGEIDRAIAEREALIRQAPDNEEFHRDLILDLNFADGDDGGRVAMAGREWHRRFAAPLAASRVPHSNDRDPDRRLRVGIVGDDQLRRHTLCNMLLPITAAHDRSQFELYAYSDLPPEQEDAATAQYRQHMTWRRTARLADEAFAAAIRQDRIDVLIDPVAFVGGSRLLALARKPAPLQLSFPLMGTCGGDTIDYVVADERILPKEQEQYFAERVLRVPFAYCQVIPAAELPPIGPAPARSAGGAVTFGSMNSLPKISRRAIQAWARILDRVPNSRLLVKANFSFRDEKVGQDFLRRFADLGIAAGRVELVPWAPDQAAHMATYNRIDVALDSFPYSGVTTSFETLAMGVPLVTRVGRRVLERFGLSILKAIGFEEGIAWSDDDYVERAVALAADPGRLDGLRRTLRERLLVSPACDARAVAASLETGIREKWREWCAGLGGRTA